MELNGYIVNGIKYPKREFVFGTPVPIIDEGSFYRIDSVHILDKAKILDIEVVENKILVHTKKETVILDIAFAG